MRSFDVRRLASFLLALAIGAPSAGRAQSIADSVFKLNRAGLWGQAGMLAAKAIPAATPGEEKCRLMIGGSSAAAHAGQTGSARQVLRMIDAECGATMAAKTY